MVGAISPTYLKDLTSGFTVGINENAAGIDITKKRAEENFITITVELALNLFFINLRNNRY